MGDISKVRILPRSTDILVGCYPCQGFSIYGAWKYNNEPQNFLYMQFVIVLSQTKPKFFLAENVKDPLYGYGRIILKEMLKKFKSRGYMIFNGI